MGIKTNEKSLAYIEANENAKADFIAKRNRLIGMGYDERTAIQGTFSIPGKTRIIEDAPISSNLLTVDSTVGFGTTGTLIANGVNGINTITYTDKTINQFCVIPVSSIF